MNPTTSNLHFPSKEILEKHLAEHSATRNLSGREREIAGKVAEFFGNKDIPLQQVPSYVFMVTVRNTPREDLIRRLVDVPFRHRKAHRIQLAELRTPLPPQTPSRGAEVAALRHNLVAALMDCVSKPASNPKQAATEAPKVDAPTHFTD